MATALINIICTFYAIINDMLCWKKDFSKQKTVHAEFISAPNQYAQSGKIASGYNHSYGLHPNSQNDARAFTLAEVLITLGIIGVVAAMTVPVLMQNIQDKQFKEAAKAAYSKAFQAVQLMKNDNGGSLSYYYTTANSFKSPFSGYFKIARDCDYYGCLDSPTASQVYKTSAGNNAGMYIFNGQFISTDGIFWGLYNDGPNNGCGNKICITVDVNGYGKGPNVLGRDVFMFQLYNDALLPMGAKNTWLYWCDKTGSQAQNGMGCMEYVMEGKDY